MIACNQSSVLLGSLLPLLCNLTANCTSGVSLSYVGTASPCVPNVPCNFCRLPGKNPFFCFERKPRSVLLGITTCLNQRVIPSHDADKFGAPWPCVLAAPCLALLGVNAPCIGFPPPSLDKVLGPYPVSCTRLSTSANCVGPDASPLPLSPRVVGPYPVSIAFLKSASLLASDRTLPTMGLAPHPGQTDIMSRTAVRFRLPAMQYYPASHWLPASLALHQLSTQLNLWTSVCRCHQEQIPTMNGHTACSCATRYSASLPGSTCPLPCVAAASCQCTAEGTGINDATPTVIYDEGERSPSIIHFCSLPEQLHVCTPEVHANDTNAAPAILAKCSGCATYPSRGLREWLSRGIACASFCTGTARCPPLALQSLPPVKRHLPAERTCAAIMPCHYVTFHSSFFSLLSPRAYRLHPCCGQRIGEAATPGPKQALLTSFFQQPLAPDLHFTSKLPDARNQVVFAVVNPTTILYKTPSIQQLKADIVVYAETAAVKQAQTIMTKDLRKIGHRVHWGHPVPSHSREGANVESLRGLAGGVAISTTLPSYKPRSAPDDQLLGSCRYVEAFVRIGPLTVRVIAIYGKPSSHSDSRETNQHLLQAAYERVCQCRIPAIVAGDFNEPIHGLPAGQSLLAKGFQEAFSLHKHRTGQELPPTCRNATRNDTLLIDPALVPYWDRAWVLNDLQLFDAHEPLCVCLRIPAQRPCQWRWDLPNPWSQHEPDPKRLSKNFLQYLPALKRVVGQSHNVDELSSAFRQWAVAVEDSVHSTLQDQHQEDPVTNPCPGLSRRDRGRCRPRKLVRRPVIQCSRPGRHGDFLPDHDATTVLARLKVKQVRRVESLLRTARSRVQALGTFAPTVQHVNEWRATTSAHGYPPAFPTWVLQIAHFQTYPCFPPDPAWLEDLLSYLRFDCNALVAQEAAVRKEKFLLREKLDSKFAAARQGFANVRGPSNPPFTEVPAHRTAHVCFLEVQGPEQNWYSMQENTPFFQLTTATLDGQCCTVVEVDAWRILIRGNHLPVSGLLEQHHVACTSEDLAADFVSFWQPLWQRDDSQTDFTTGAWPHLAAMLENVPAAAPLQLDMDSVAIWRAAIDKMADHRATGICGWRPAELKLLPDAAVEILAALFSRALVVGVPPHLLVASISVLAKVPCPEHIRQSRPIVVFSTIYRIWASVASRQILKHWGSIFPPAVMGSMPGRSARDLSYQQQHLIERAILDGNVLYGLSLDIVKCFNCLPIFPLTCMMKRLGIPVALVDCWATALGKMEKFPVLLNSLGPPITATNGVPEGDPLSVVAMAAVCFCAAHQPAAQQVAFKTYVDNWTWQAESKDLLSTTTLPILEFLSNLRLTVDWQKTYTWCTEKKGRAWLQGPGQSLFPTDRTVQVVAARCELGTPFQFCPTPDLSTRNLRLQTGHERLRNLARQPRPVLEKARFVQSSVWPATFFGAEGHSHAKEEVSRLRTAAAYAIIGEHKTMSPFLALSAVTSAVQDPQLFLMEQQLQQLRRALWHDTETGLGVLEDLQRGNSRSAFGPSGALRLNLPRLGLTLTSHGILSAPDLVSIDMFTCNRHQLRRILQMAWVHQVAEAVQHRNGLRAKLLPDPLATAKLLKALKPPEMLVLARHVAGGFSSGASKHLWDESVPEQCPLCGQLDTKEHRILQCPATQQVRDRWEPYVSYAVRHFPHWVHGPFAVVPNDVEVPRLVLCRRKLVPVDNPPALAITRQLSRLRLFTDGSCINPHSTWGKLAAWSLVLDTTQQDEEIPSLLDAWRRTGVAPAGFTVVAQGGVPGEQSINRAEECAIAAAAAQFVQRCHHQTAEVWSDSTFAITEHSRVVNGEPSFYPDIANMMGQASPHKLCLRKVKSHQQLDKLWGLQLWVAAGNAFADTAAKDAVARDFGFLKDILEEVATSEADQHASLRLFHRFLLDLSAEEWRQKQAVAKGIVSHEVASIADAMPAQKDSAWLSLCPSQVGVWAIPDFDRQWLLACSWPPQFTVPLWAWLQQLQWDQTSCGSVGVTGLELLVDFVVTTGHCPPVRATADGGYLSFREATLYYPVTQRAWVQAVLEAARQLSRLSGHELLPKRRAKVFALRKLGHEQCRGGLQLRPKWQQPEQNLLLLKKILHEGGVQGLIDFARKQDSLTHAADRQLLVQYSQMSPNERDVLGRKLRQGRSR